MTGFRTLAVVALMVAIGYSQDQAHSDPFRVPGRVLDDNNAPLAGAEITARIGGMALRTFSDPTGAFILELAQPGEYNITVSLPGYFDLRGRQILLQPDSKELTLTLSRVRERIESLDVSGVAPVIDMDKTVRDERLNNAELMQVPYRNNNDLRNAMRVMPGIVQDQQDGIHVNGAAENQVQYTLNGFNITDPLTGTFQSRLSVEAVQSMSVLSGTIPAEYGKGAAGIFAVETKRGDDRFRYSATNFFPGVEYRKSLIVGSWNPRFNFSGPIRKGKIWFSDNFAAQYSQDVVKELPPGQDRNTSWRLSNSFRTQVNLTPSNILHSGFLMNYWIAPKSGLSALDPPETTVNRKATQWFADIKDQFYFGRGSLLEYGYASNRTFGSQVPQGTGYYEYTPIGRSGNFYIDGSQRSSRDQWMANYFLPSFSFFGSHQIKIGADLDHLSYWQNLTRTGFLNYRANYTLAREVRYEGSGRLNRSNVETAAYVQDSWRVRPGLLFEVGVRADHDQILENWNVAPRAGFAWSPWKLERTKISGGYGVVYSATNLVLFTRSMDQYPISAFYPEYGGYPLYTVSSYIVDRTLRTPRYRNFNLSWEQRFNNGFVTTVQAIARRGTHGLSYFDTTGLAPSTIYQLQDGRRDEYTAIEFTVRHNIRRKYQWLASYTRSISRSNAVLDLNVDQPLIVTDNAGRLPWDAPNRLLSWGFLPTPLKNWTFAYLIEWHTGFPFSIRDEQGVIVGDVNSQRFPDFFELDFGLEREFEIAGQRWAWRMGLNDATNHQNYTLVNDQLGSPRFLQFYGSQGRAVNFRVRWLGKL
jgi:hypothetical protein